jgi:hypothetical protein
VLNQINREAYLCYARALKQREKELQKIFGQWLPQNIIDCHAHSNLRCHVESVPLPTFNHMMSTFPYFSIEESREYHQLFYGQQKVQSLRFPKTFRGINHKAANAYLLAESAAEDRIALYGLPDDIPYTIAQLSHPRVSALKMYPSYLTPPATQVLQYFPATVLAAAEERGIPIILHPPAIVTKCWQQIAEVCESFPDLKVVLAHLGLTKMVVPELREAYEQLCQYPQLMLDTALVPSEEVVGLALEVFGCGRVMFGSDEPLNLIRSTAYDHPTLGQRLITEFPYHWVNPKEHGQYQHLAKDVIHAHWQSMLAIKGAIERFPCESQETIKRMVFHDNAKSFFGFD